jgi:hypothetical protein
MIRRPATARLLTALAISFISCSHTNGFTTPAPSFASTNHISHTNKSQTNQVLQRSNRAISLNAKEKKESTGLAPGVSKNLLAETIAPFRGLRLFFYASFASGAFVGGLITLSGVAAALSGVRSDVDLNTEYINLAIDFGAVALFGVLAKIDLDKGEELRQKVDEKVENKKKQKKIVKSMREREERLSQLELDVRVTEDGETRRASVGVMQEKAKQHVILVAGPGRVVRDALRGAQLNKVSFILVGIDSRCVGWYYEL